MVRLWDETKLESYIRFPAITEGVDEQGHSFTFLGLGSKLRINVLEVLLRSTFINLQCKNRNASLDRQMSQ